jgi:S-methylmethionine-dependent homocysteine/selenocysteine methylase
MTTIGGGKIDEVFSRRIITKTQIKTTERSMTTSVYPSQVAGTAPYPFSLGVNQNSFTTNYPTEPSSEIEISFCASTANSIGSCCSTSFTKPLTTRPTASSWLNPRCTQ